MPHLLELFSGTGSVGRAFLAKGWDVTTVDLDIKRSPDICCDIIDFDVSMLEGRPPVDIVWASPPCTHYSTCRTTGGPRNLVGSDAMVQKTLDIIRELGAEFFMENPQTGLLKSRAVVAGIPMRTLDYCKYGTLYRKRTAIWTNTSWSPARPLCQYDCGHTIGRRHMMQAQTGHQELHLVPVPRLRRDHLYALPAALCEEFAAWADAAHGGGGQG